MADKRSAAIGASAVAVLIGGAIAWAGSQGGAAVRGIPVFAIAVGLAFLVQWLVFIPSYLMRTERYYDLTGSLTYISIMLFAVLASGHADARSILLLMLVLVWAGRLGAFLFRRVLLAGKDSRFDELKSSFSRFLMTWTLQGLWVCLTLAAALAAVTSNTPAGFDAFALIGLLVWLTGFSIEAVADHQKSRFRADSANKGAFISSGLWAWSRHPNYFGEIVLWTGVAIIALPALTGWQLATLISPVFVYLLLTRVSGIPLLEGKADEKWGGQEAYETYKQRTPVLVPWIGRRGG
jgi:steroid 5-alpha reductase family enzyme